MAKNSRKTYGSMKDVATAVDENGGLITASLLELREALGRDRLGVRVLRDIAGGLEGEGLGYFPEWVLAGDENDAPRAGHILRVFKKGAAVGEVIMAVLDP